MLALFPILLRYIGVYGATEGAHKNLFQYPRRCYSILRLDCVAAFATFDHSEGQNGSGREQEMLLSSVLLSHVVLV